MLDVCLLGCGGMVPLPYRHLTALAVTLNGKLLLIDCGEGTQVSMREHKTGFKALDAILLTHLHADHTAGLPGLLLTAGNAGRTEPISVYGPAGTAALMKSVKIIAPEIPFDIMVHEDETEFTWNGCSVSAFPCFHSVPCFGYALTLPRAGRFSAAKAKELGVPVALWHTLQKGQAVTVDGKEISPSRVLGPGRQGLKLVYCTDTRPVPELSAALEGADLAVLEGMYTEEKDAKNAEEKQHMTMTEAAALCAGAGVKSLWLTHYSPKVAPLDEAPGAVTSLFPAAEPGFDGKSVTLRFCHDQ